MDASFGLVLGDSSRHCKRHQPKRCIQYIIRANWPRSNTAKVTCCCGRLSRQVGWLLLYIQSLSIQKVAVLLLLFFFCYLIVARFFTTTLLLTHREEEEEGTSKTTRRTICRLRELQVKALLMFLNFFFFFSSRAFVFIKKQRRKEPFSLSLYTS